MNSTDEIIAEIEAALKDWPDKPVGYCVACNCIGKGNEMKQLLERAEEALSKCAKVYDDDNLPYDLSIALENWPDKHTPGTWRYTKRFGRYSILDSSHSFDNRSLDADARLITASPDLLDALQGLMYKDSGEPAFIVARAAIEKATGAAK